MDQTLIGPVVGGTVPTVLGLVFLTIGLVRTRTVRGWTRTTGVVVDRRTGRADRGATALYPTFQWQDQHGRVHQHTSAVRQSLGPSPGTAVPVLYDPDDPARGLIDSFVQSGRIFLWIGAGLLALGLVVGSALTTLLLA